MNLNYVPPFRYWFLKTNQGVVTNASQLDVNRLSVIDIHLSTVSAFIWILDRPVQYHGIRQYIGSLLERKRIFIGLNSVIAFPAKYWCLSIQELKMQYGRNIRLLFSSSVNTWQSFPKISPNRFLLKCKEEFTSNRRKLPSLQYTIFTWKKVKISLILIKSDQSLHAA